MAVASPQIHPRNRFRAATRAVALLTLCGFLSACGHLNKSSSAPVSYEPTPESQSAPVEINSTSEPATDADTIVTSEPEIANDLITRITQGFRLPEFRSKHIDDYERWNSQHPTYLNNLFARAEPFLFYIVEELDKRNMPLELALLPAIESAYKPEAVSRSSAAGLWQFIPLTARHYGMKRDWWYDARLDPIVATNTALNYLQELNVMFDGDWHLTLAAYNAGQGTIKKAIARKQSRWNKKVEFQDLKLRRETTHYIPKLYALRNILADPDRFGVELPNIPNQAHFFELALHGQTDLKQFSELSGVPLPELRHMNAGHRRWATSPTGPHRLLVPLEAEQAARAAAEQLAASPSIEYQHHRIGSGETLSGISRRYGVSVAALQQANNLSGTNIRAGRSLMIPVAKRDIAQPDQKAEDSSGTRIAHQVARGDTLWSIAKRYRVKVEQLRSWNQLPVDQILNLNQVLTVFVN